MNDILLKEIENILKLTESNEIILKDRKQIPYGEKLYFEKGLLQTSLSLYYSKKKGVSKVFGGKNNSLKEDLEELLLSNETKTFSHNWKSWLGTDESGKGDFFGPLVAAGFICHHEDILTLRKFGVKDSKMLNDKKIKEIAKKIYEKFSKNISVIIINPQRYNSLYADFQKSGKKLNQLLAWMHGRIIKDAHQKNTFQAVIVDKFAHEKVLLNSLKGLNEINIVQRTKAEEDVAVASASIIARYHFLEKMESMSKKYEIEFPKGASAKVIEIGRIFMEKFGEEKLNEVSKKHFKTFDKIKGKV